MADVETLLKIQDNIDSYDKVINEKVQKVKLVIQDINTKMKNA